jgi:hypothetical protein
MYLPPADRRFQNRGGKLKNLPMGEPIRQVEKLAATTTG